MRFFVIFLFAASVFSQENVKIGIVEQKLETSDGSETEKELITVNLRKPNEDITFVVS